MASYTQNNRLLSIYSALGDDVLLLRSFQGQEGISRLFSFQLDLLSEHDAITPTALVGTNVTWVVQGVDSDPRYFNGMIRRMAAGGRGARGLRAYRIEVVPWLWFLTRTADCRIFQNWPTPKIVEAIFQAHGFTDYVLNLSGSYRPWEYCVQYRETAFNFVSRLLEQEGIFYYFQHDNGSHTLVLGDSSKAVVDCGESEVSFSGDSLAPNHVVSWEHRYEYRSGKWTATDYNFETPSVPLLSSTDTLLNLPNITDFEIFDYPGQFMKKADGKAEAKLRIEEEEAAFNVVVGSGRCCTFTPGGRFTLDDHEIPTEMGGYLITTIEHAAIDRSYHDSAGGSDYSNSFTCIPDSVAYRPARVTPKPIVQGPQTAVVVGPSGEEIYVDKYGRIKVQFFWDRVGTKDENSSCWMRVAQQWAGRNWGFVATPRIGQEVMVDFLEGDPDRPIVTGRVYNAEQMPPYDLPANMTQTGLKTRSSKGGGPDNFNEIRFEDLKGSEKLSIHAEKDQEGVVENDESHSVGNDRAKTIGRDEKTKVGRHRTETVGGNEAITVSGNRKKQVAGDERTGVDGNRNEQVGKSESTSIGGSRSASVSGNEGLTVGGGRTQTISKDDSLSVGKTLVITAADSITLQTGDASIVMTSNGDISITGNNITIKGSGSMSSEAGKDMTLKAQKIGQN